MLDQAHWRLAPHPDACCLLVIGIQRANTMQQAERTWEIPVVPCMLTGQAETLFNQWLSCARRWHARGLHDQNPHYVSCGSQTTANLVQRWTSAMLEGLCFTCFTRALHVVEQCPFCTLPGG